MSTKDERRVLSLYDNVDPSEGTTDLTESWNDQNLPSPDPDFRSEYLDAAASGAPSRFGVIDVPNGVEENTLFLRDGRRRIDMILAYETPVDIKTAGEEAKRASKRRVFEENLMKEGLVLEVEEKEKSFDLETSFVKIHCPWDVLRKYAEVMNIKLPIKEKDLPQEETYLPRLKSIFSYDKTIIGDRPSFYTATYTREREQQFMKIDPERILSPAQRSEIVWQVLTRTRFDYSDKVGIRRLINDKVYLAAYPLHSGRYDRDNPAGPNLDRRLLYLEWARPSKWFKSQPLWLIKQYFGERIGLYFAWLGFYTAMLIPASIVGVIVFIYGLASMGSDANIPSKEICDPDIGGQLMICPSCDKACSYMALQDSCFFAKMTYLFDNPATVFFAVFMSFWATTFLEMWKRRQTVLQWEWDMRDVEEDQEPRLEYELKVKRYRINPITKEREPYVPAYTRIAKYTVTGVMVLFMVAVVVAALLGTIIYRISVLSVIHASGDVLFRENAKIISSATAALINLVIIVILQWVYEKLAIWMVNLENPRTQEEFEDSYTFKIFIFQFVNYYSSLIYIAFFKGRFFLHPGDVDARKTGFLQLRTDVCDPAGCLPELFIQLAVIMVGKQAFNNFVEILLPAVLNWWRKRNQVKHTVDQQRKFTRWEEDYALQNAGVLALFDEHLEMVMQYGFVTLFVAAFPLAPLFALLNNLCEIRIDAYKMLVQTRRQISQRVKDIGAWYGILQGITFTAVVFNGFVIAFTSDFIARLVYVLAYSPTSDLRGFNEFRLSEFNTSDYTADMGADTNEPDPAICWYRGFRNGPESSEKYEVNIVYWHIFFARLAFVVVFEHIVFGLTGLMAYIIPDVPTSVKTQIMREKLLDREAKYEHAGCNENEKKMKKELNKQNV